MSLPRPGPAQIDPHAPVTRHWSAAATYWYKGFQGLAGGPIVYDLAGRCHGQVMGAPEWIPSTRAGLQQRYSGNAGTDGIQTRAIPGPRFTLCAWVTLAAATGDYKSIVTVQTPNYLLWGIGGTSLSLWASDGVTNASLGITGLQAEVPYHLALVRSGHNDPAGYKAFLNGRPTGTIASGTWTPTLPMIVGYWPGQTWHGLLDDVRCYPVALTAEQIHWIWADSATGRYTAVRRPTLPMAARRGAVAGPYATQAAAIYTTGHRAGRLYTTGARAGAITPYV